MHTSLGNSFAPHQHLRLQGYKYTYTIATKKGRIAPILRGPFQASATTSKAAEPRRPTPAPLVERDGGFRKRKRARQERATHTVPIAVEHILWVNRRFFVAASVDARDCDIGTHISCVIGPWSCRSSCNPRSVRLTRKKPTIPPFNLKATVY